jgi:hypothetical protein
MKFLFAFALLLFTACMKPESIAGAKPDLSESGIIDNDLLAGATSSTNWPPEEVFPNRISARGEADSQLVIQFYEFITPAKVTGKVTLFQGGIVPLLDSVPSRSFEFSEKDTLFIPESAFIPLRQQDSDTVRFSLKIETDTSECLFLGFAYSIKQKVFINSPFSIPSLSTAILTESKFSFKGTVDSSLALFGPSFAGKSEWCFYIPGTPYFWMAERVKAGDTLNVGRLPTGKYPLRLIRIQAQAANQRMNLLEVYSIKVTRDSTTISRGFSLDLGNRILAHEISNASPIRPESM